MTAATSQLCQMPVHQHPTLMTKTVRLFLQGDPQPKCHELQCRLQTQLRSCIAVAVMQAAAAVSVQSQAWEFPYAAGAALKRKKEKKKEWNLYFPTPLVFLKVSPSGLQSQTFQSLIFLMQDLQAGVPNVWLRPLALWRESLQL